MEKAIKQYNYIQKKDIEIYKHPIKSSISDYKLNRYKKKKGHRNVERYNPTDGKYLIADNFVYFDIETVKWNDIIIKRERWEEKDISPLNTDMNNLYQFSLFTTDEKEQEKLLLGLYEGLEYCEVVKPNRKSRRLNFFKRHNFKIFNENESDEIIFDIRYKDGGMYLNLHSLNTHSTIKILDFIATQSKLNWCGFNSNRFDSLIFRHLNYDLKRNDRKNYIEISKDIDYSRFSNKIIHIKKYIYDILPIAKSYGFTDLKSVGSFLNIEKLEHSGDSFKDSVDYNNRDVFIPYMFVKYLNNDGIYYNNFASYVRKLFINNMFKNSEVEYIHSDKKWNKFELIAGRTENYIYELKEGVEYYDFNSLYTSARTKLKVVGYDKFGKNLNFNLKKVYKKDYDEFFIKLEKIKNLLFLKYDSYDFDYEDLSSLYDEFFDDKSFVGFFKIKNIKKDIPEHIKEKLLFYFPFSYKSDNDRRLFQFKKFQTYQITFYETLFLAFFDFDIVEMYEVKLADDLLKNELEDYYAKRLTIKNQMKELEKQGLKDSEEYRNLNSKQMYIKLLINAGFGVFGTSNTKSEEIDMKADNELVRELNRLKEVKGDLYNLFLRDTHFTNGYETFKIVKQGKRYYKQAYQFTKKYTDNSIPGLAISIVSNSRFMMYSNIFLNNVMSEGTKKEIYYTDTDSAFVNNSFRLKLNDKFIGNELGQMGDELSSDEKIIGGFFLAPKAYYYFKKNSKNEIKCKMTLKGSGDEYFIRDSISNNINGFQHIEIKKAFNEETRQKRTLINGHFENRMSEDNYNWREIYLYASIYSFMVRYLAENKNNIDFDRVKKYAELNTKDLLNKSYDEELEFMKFVRMGKPLNWKKEV